MNADRTAQTRSAAGFLVTTQTVDVSSRASVHALIDTATALGGGVTASYRFGDLVPA